MQFDSRLNNTWWALRLAYGIVPIAAGADKFMNLLVNWEKYLDPMVPRLLHMQATTFMHIVGVIEIVAGVLVLTSLTRYAAYIVGAWLIGIALNLLGQGAFLDVAVRDLFLSVGAFSLAKLTEVRESEGMQVVTESSPLNIRTRSAA